MGKLTTVGIDLAKDVIAACVLDMHGAVIERRVLSGKLGAVLFQFAPWVAFHPKNREHIDECQRRLDGYQLAVEFRNKSWFEGKHTAMTLDFERERGLVNVIVDEPPDY